jgi:hypothetical protein
MKPLAIERLRNAAGLVSSVMSIPTSFPAEIGSPGLSGNSCRPAGTSVGGPERIPVSVGVGLGT